LPEFGRIDHGRRVLAEIARIISVKKKNRGKMETTPVKVKQQVQSSTPDTTEKKDDGSRTLGRRGQANDRDTQGNEGSGGTQRGDQVYALKPLDCTACEESSSLVFVRRIDLISRFSPEEINEMMKPPPKHEGIPAPALYFHEIKSYPTTASPPE
jgi:hypothetical protein